MNSSKEILKKYWNHSSFREPQDDIIKAVLQKNDVIALLPTGGGKSVCFQIPALMMEGVCLVISPLIALMEDQVENLKSRNIKATKIKSGATQDEIILLFDAIKFGNYKFLYISPERLQSTFIQQKINELNISFVAIDEAHCISEWGHDFRPSYRNIKILRDLKPSIKFIALTATANNKVLKDITTNLDLKDHLTFKKSFFRENLAYQVFNVEDKLLRLQQIFTKTKKPSIVYVNSRKTAEELSHYLNSKNFKSSFYHAGMPNKDKKIAFDNWMNEVTPIMISTNAFGMGIDKNNVGIVVHYNLPLSIENYVQESGRAGRNNLKSFGVILKNENDIFQFQERLKKSIPTILEVKEIHKKLYQYFRISYGEIIDENYPFNLLEFSRRYNFKPKKVESVLKILVNNSVLEITKTYNQKSTIIFKTISKNVISYAINNIYIKTFVNSLLRTYTGLHKQEVKVDEFLLAKKNNTTSIQIIQHLEQLEKDEILIYKKVISDSEIRFLIPREDDKTINRIKKEIEKINHQKIQKAGQLISFLNQNNICRSIQVLNYFDEKSTKKCGICDVCLSKKSTKINDISNQILAILSDKKQASSQEINHQINANEKDILIHLRELLSEDKIYINNQNKYQLNKK